MELDALVVGAGFAGLYMLHRLRKIFPRVKAFEAGGDVGGTWYWNRYPGARCDVPSMEYSYSFDKELQQEWVWSERYSPQPEILKYINHVADRLKLRDDIRFNTRVKSAVFQEATNTWVVTTDNGLHVVTRFLIMATGCLSAPNQPHVKGLESFQGKVYYTSSWPHEPVPLAGKRVGLIGTGSSGVQTLPVIASEAAEVTVFQRTPVYSVPARNRPLPRDEQDKVKANYDAFR